jgi:phosphate:Na+ symporter
MQAELVESLRLAVALFLNGERQNAARLLARKVGLRQMEAQATALHVRLLRDAATDDRAGDAEKAGIVNEKSGLFLRIVCDLRRVHSHIAAFAYPLSRKPRSSALPAALDQHGTAGSCT